MDCISLRFIQFRRKNSPSVRFGAISNSGNYFADLSSQCIFPHSFIDFISSPDYFKEMENVLCKLKVEPINDEITLLPPVINPKKIVVVDRDIEQKTKFDVCAKTDSIVPLFSSKLPSTLTGPTSIIELPDDVTEIRCSTELAVIIGSHAFQVSAREATNFIFGYTVAQRIEAVKFANDGNCVRQHLISASSDKFCPIGPSIVHHSLIPDPYCLTTTCKINGALVQCDETKGMKFKIANVIEFFTQFISLSPGDIILMGMNELSETYRCDCSQAKRGDVIESEICLIGCLRNVVK